MHGVTTAIVAFIFVGVLFPRIIKYKAQFYGALAAVMLVIILSALDFAIRSEGFSRFVAVALAILQIGAIFLLILSAGGLTVKDLAGEFADAIEVVRRGGEKKEIIVPIGGQQPRPRAVRDDDDDDDANWTTVTPTPGSTTGSTTASATGTTTTTTPAAGPRPGDTSVPLE